VAPDPDPNRRKARVASIVIIVTMLGWMGASWIGGMIGLPIRYAFLFDFAAIAALIWALVVLFQVWQSGRR
jgi:predicted MFS family arabinose efflux permease